MLCKFCLHFLFCLAHNSVFNYVCVCVVCHVCVCESLCVVLLFLCSALGRICLLWMRLVSAVAIVCHLSYISLIRSVGASFSCTNCVRISMETHTRFSSSLSLSHSLNSYLLPTLPIHFSCSVQARPVRFHFDFGSHEDFLIGTFLFTDNRTLLRLYLCPCVCVRVGVAGL